MDFIKSILSVGYRISLVKKFLGVSYLMIYFHYSIRFQYNNFAITKPTKVYNKKRHLLQCLLKISSKINWLDGVPNISDTYVNTRFTTIKQYRHLNKCLKLGAAGTFLPSINFIFCTNLLIFVKFFKSFYSYVFI